MAAGTEPLVSVMINCFNGATYLKEAIDSVYAQTYPHWEIVFWDNASTDESEKIARGYDSRLRYFRSERTMPLYAARKLAMQECRGEVIGFLDTDDLWHPRKLERQLPCFGDREDVGLIYTNAEILNEDGTRRAKFKAPQPEGNIFGSLIERYTLCLPTVLVYRKICDKHHLTFDEAFSFSGDADLFLQLAQVSRAAYLHEVTATYRQHSASGTLGRLNVIAYEVERILQKLGELDHQFFDKYRSEIVRFRLQGQLSVLAVLWRMGKTRDMRTIIRAHWRTLASWIPVFLASYFPERDINWFRHRIR